MTSKRDSKAAARMLPPAGTKEAKILALITRKQGATHSELCAATGWQTCRTRPVEVADRAGLTVFAVKEPGQPVHYVARRRK